MSARWPWVRRRLAPQGAARHRHREEIHLPIAGEDDTPPAELTMGHTRGVRLEPVAWITTNRDRWELVGGQGTLLAEITDDRVTAGAPSGSSTVDSWREVEVELAGDSDGKLLEETERRLRQAGIRRSEFGSKLARVLHIGQGDPAEAHRRATAGEVVVAYLREQAEALVHNDLLARMDADDAVHQMRVATRRMRSALRVFGRVVDRDRTRRLYDELKWVAGRLGPARDLEVIEAHFRRSVAELPSDLVVGPVSARLTRYFSPAAADARQTVLRTLQTKRYLRLLDAIAHLLTDPPLTERAGRNGGKELPRQVRRAYRKTARRMRDVESSSDRAARDTALHSARKAAKRLRCAAEVAAPVIGKPANRTRKRAKDLTKVLGEHQDAVVARPVLRELGMRAHLAGENGFTFGLLYHREQTRASRAEGELPPCWERAAARKHRRWFA